MSNENNPIKIVEINKTDHREPRPPGPIEHKIFGDGATQSHRSKLARNTENTLSYLKSYLLEWPGVPGVAKVTLKEEALAKSHRPTALFSTRSCPIIGTMGYGEILISATLDGLSELKRRILESETKRQVANISAIEKIEPYSKDERTQGFSTKQRDILCRESGTVKLRLFDHKDEIKNANLREALYNYAQLNEINIRELRYGNSRDLLAIEPNSAVDTEKLSRFIGLRSLDPMPSYRPTDFGVQTTPVGSANVDSFPPPTPDGHYPVVGVIDSGVCPNSNLIQPWVHARESFVPRGLEDYSHGTMVAGLIVNSHSLNHHDPKFPKSQAKIVDVNVFPKQGSVREEDLIAIIEQVVPKYPEAKVWNLSLGGDTPSHPTDFSDFARFLDEMHDKHGCLFVIAAGNQNNKDLWPTMACDPLRNRISSPADSVRALTVGSVAHQCTARSLVKCEETSPFSRIGPGPCFIPKPEITHYGGNTTETGMYAQLGVLSLGPNNSIYESIGTSFAAPIACSITAAVNHFLSDGGRLKVPPERTKALMIHSALIAHNNQVSSETLNYYGFGKPSGLTNSLYCDDHCITLLFETDVLHGGYEFERVPFPIPDCLINTEGKFKGEILMTLVYSPITDKEFASEYCRTNVDAGMGSYDPDDTGIPRFQSRVPQAPNDLNHLYEKAQIENGFKWSPVKAYHKVFPRGVDVSTWRLKMKVTRRAEDERPRYPQKATLVLSFRSLDPELPVYNQAIQKLNQAGWITHDIDAHLRIKF
ncbi:S8 family anti-phage peptidase IteS [Microbulbifer sp. TRSA001]|uniref:S8 family anti-phage peptidase IteS n=1 Tax=Microbulbifer sp. TRSA001 TaxID=3243381 RepID=UPI004038FCFB